MGFKLSLAMALGIVSVLKDNFRKKMENYDSHTDIRTQVIDFISFLMRESGRCYNYSKEKHRFLWNEEMSNEFTNGRKAGFL